MSGLPPYLRFREPSVHRLPRIDLARARGNDPVEHARGTASVRSFIFIAGRTNQRCAQSLRFAGQLRFPDDPRLPCLANRIGNDLIRCDEGFTPHRGQCAEPQSVGAILSRNYQKEGRHSEQRNARSDGNSLCNRRRDAQAGEAAGPFTAHNARKIGCSYFPIGKAIRNHRHEVLSASLPARLRDALELTLRHDL